MGIPFCWHTVRTMSSATNWYCRANSLSTAARSAGFQLDHPLGWSNAARAAATARSTSPSLAAMTEPTRSPVGGDWTGIVLLVGGGVASPLAGANDEAPRPAGGRRLDGNCAAGG